MAMRQSKMILLTAVYVLGMLLFAEAQNDVIREIIVANAGENITIRCNTKYTSDIYWVIDRYLIAAVDVDYPEGLVYDDSRFIQPYAMEISSGLFELYIYDARAESAIYACRYSNSHHVQEYDVRVIGCSTCFVNASSPHDSEQPRNDVNCHLNNFNTDERIRLHITMNKNRTNTAVIEDSILIFNISNHMMYGTIQVEFNPFNDTLSNVTCIVPAQLTTPESDTLDKLFPSSSPITVSATLSSKTSTTKSETTGTKPYDSTSNSYSSPIMYTSYSTFGTITSPSTQQITISATSSSKILAKTSATKSETTTTEITTAAITTIAGTKYYDSSPKTTSSMIMDTSYLSFGTTPSPSTPPITIPATSSSKTLATKSETTLETTSTAITTTGKKSYDSTPKPSSSPNIFTSYLTFGTTTSPSFPPITISVTSSATTSATTSATKSETTSESTSASITTTGAKPYDSSQKSSSSPNIFTSYLTFETTPSPSTSPITIPATSSSKTSATTSATKSETTSETTSAAITTIARTKSHDSTPKSTSSPFMDTSYLTFGTITSNHTRKNIHPETGNNTKNNSFTIIIITTLGCILIIVAIVIIVVLRLKQRRDRQQGERNAVEINDSVDDEVATDSKQNTSYQSFGRLSGIRQGELMNNVLCEFRDGIIQNSILRSGDDELHTDLYTVPDKTGIINRVAKTEIESVSSHRNSSMNRHQHEQNESKQEDEKADMPNLGAEDHDTNIPIYAMPEKGPRSTGNTMKTSPGSVSTEDGAEETRV